MRLMGLDLGERRIGVAVSDPSRVLARGVEVIERRSLEKDLETIGHLAEEYEVETMVVGYPRRLDGTAGEEAKKAEAFAAQIEAHLGVSVVLWDERLSTVRAARALAEGGKRKRRLGIDAVAAVVILQDYLDSLKFKEES